ncbi:Cation efflux protein [Beggiatoa sp. PS]|nr:Cation efflux protein [Beggiatoa sp. PS]
MSSRISQQQRYIAIRNITFLAITANILLTIIKIIFGIIGQSHALIADGLHSLSDLIAGGMTLIAVQYSTQPPDIEHPYGHARFETLVTVAVGGLLLLMAVGLLIDVQRRIFEPELLLQPTAISLVAAILSIIVKEALYHYTMYIAKRIRSPMLEANAWHHRSDAISSMIVLIGVAGSMIGFLWLDAVATIGISLMIGYLGFSLSWTGLSQLVDTGLKNNSLVKIKEIIQSVTGVRSLHQLRTRKMGSNVLVDAHILVDPHISLSEGHQIGEVVRTRLMANRPEILDVLVHVDPENDEEMLPVVDLPLRDEITARLQQHWQSLGISGKIEKITLYYLSDKLTVDIDLPLTLVQNIEDAEKLAQRFVQLVTKESDIEEINIYYHSYSSKSVRILKINELQQLVER